MRGAGDKPVFYSFLFETFTLYYKFSGLLDVVNHLKLIKWGGRESVDHQSSCGRVKIDRNQQNIQF